MNTINNISGSERSVEIPFTVEAIKKYFKKSSNVLEIGGIPSNEEVYSPIKTAIAESESTYNICDFRGGKYRGDFISYDFGIDTFDIIMLISTIEHFPQCTEGPDRGTYKEGEDIKGYKKALSLLNEGGLIILTVPFGKPVWQAYHQNYNMDLILQMCEGSSIIDSRTYILDDSTDTWILTNPKDMEEVLYTSKAYGVGCFILSKD